MLRNVGKSLSSLRAMPGLVRHLLVAALFLVVTFGMGGCNGEVSVDQEFVNLYVELRVAEMTYGKTSPTTRLVRQDALKAAGYTRESFLAKADEILSDERQWIPFQKAVTARIDSLLAPPAASAAAPKDSSAKTGNGPQKVAPKVSKPTPQMPAHKVGVR